MPANYSNPAVPASTNPKELEEPEPKEETLKQLIEKETKREVEKIESLEGTVKLSISLPKSNAEWYSFMDFGNLEVEVDEFASNADDIIDETNQQFKIK
ncbi:34062_t:CDS:2 [Gigaspora margarita]|uniref:34062_t:CDS:1 n=1 Tax=Gigaspora margarita TaxID=4874 RepID=A0ABN7UE78_GIGMA|nr:34062_t:CDS:2 [Gigaspora margarita]